jgi:hypothetical protein
MEMNDMRLPAPAGVLVNYMTRESDRRWSAVATFF